MTTVNAAAIWNAALSESHTLRSAALAHDADTLRIVRCEDRDHLFAGDPIPETAAFLRLLADGIERGALP